MRYLLCCLINRTKSASLSSDDHEEYSSTSSTSKPPKFSKFQIRHLKNNATFVKRKRYIPRIIDDLDDQCLLSIMSFLTLDNLTVCDRVSRKWRRLVTITLSKMNAIKINHTQAVGLLGRTPNVIKLTMIGISLNDQHLNTISSNCKRLNELNLDCPRFDDDITGGDFLRKLFLSMDKITRLRLIAVEESQVAIAAPFFSKLTQLEVNYAQDLTKETVAPSMLLGANPFTKLNCSLTKLSVANCDHTHPMALPKNVHLRISLTELNVMNSSISFTTFKSILRSFINLRSFNCELTNEPINSSNIFNKFTLNSVLSLRDLRITVSGQHLITESTDLNSVQCHSMHALMSVVKNCPELRRFELRGGFLTNESFKKLKHCLLLEELTLNTINYNVIKLNNDITDSGLEHLLGLSNLKKLDLSGTAITGTGFKLLVDLVTSLKYVNITACESLLIGFQIPINLIVINDKLFKSFGNGFYMKTLEMNGTIKSDLSDQSRATVNNGISLASRLLRIRSQWSLKTDL